MSGREIPGLSQGLVVRAGDRVLVALDTLMPDAQACDTAERLAERFPDVEFTFVAGVAGLALWRDGEVPR